MAESADENLTTQEKTLRTQISFLSQQLRKEVLSDEERDKLRAYVQELRVADKLLGLKMKAAITAQRSQCSLQELQRRLKREKPGDPEVPDWLAEGVMAARMEGK